jgi:uncharacterized paraquat-inducible protein A
MGKLIFWLVVIFAVLLVLRMINVANNRSRNNQARSQQPQRDTAMIRCVECGVYLPSAEVKQGPRGPLCGDPKCAQRHEDARQ